MTPLRPKVPAAAVAALIVVACRSGEVVTAPIAADQLAIAGQQVNCAPVTLRVSSAAKTGGDGTLLHPFADLRTALAVAGKVACDVKIVLGPGVYSESDNQGQGPFSIDRSLSIVGEKQPVIQGRVVVTASGAVGLDGVDISDAPGTALQVTSQKAAVTISRAAILRAHGFGIVSAGGTLTLTAVEVANLIASGKDPASGTALVVGGGAHVELFLTRLHDDAHALYAFGDGTTVHATGLVVNNVGPDPTLVPIINAGGCSAIGYDHVGAVEFAYGAVGTGAAWLIQSPSFAGLYAHDAASVTVNDIIVDGAMQVSGTVVSAETCGGYDVVAQRGGAIALSQLVLFHADVCGVVIGPDPGTGIDLHGGWVGHSPIGACSQQDGYDTSRLNDHVRYIDVGVPLQATSYSLPSGPPSP